MGVLATILGIATQVGSFFMNLFGMKQSQQQYEEQLAAQKEYQRQQTALTLTDLSANIEILGSNIDALRGEKERVLGKDNQGGLFGEQTAEVKAMKEMASIASGSKSESGSSQAVIEDFLKKRGQERTTLETSFNTAISNAITQEDAAQSQIDTLIKNDPNIQGYLGYGKEPHPEYEEYDFKTTKKYVEYRYGITFTREDWDRLKNSNLDWSGF